MWTSNFIRDKCIWFVILVSSFKIGRCEEELPPTCSSNIYCHGPLLDTIQMAKIYEDSKTFVDMKLRFSPNQTMENFNEFIRKYGDSPTKTKVQEFVNDNFEPEGLEFKKWEPTDWKSDPPFLNNVKDPEFKQWAKELNEIWKKLGREMKHEVEVNQDHYSIIWVRHPVIVPGGRFREFYYWDSYWIIQGLLHCEMYTTAKGMLENFLYIVRTYGHIPNGGRIYYLARSQPPLLVPMMKIYLDATDEKEFITANIDIMEKEFEYWMANHTISIKKNGNNYTLATYGDRSKGPRPESYSEDIESAGLFKEDNKKEAFYSELKAAAESGWDFSSRWFVTNASNKGNLTDTHTRSIIPVDLNAIIYWNAKLLAEFNLLANNIEKADKFNSIAATWMNAVTDVLWHEEIGSWLDYDMINDVKRDYFYPTNIAPLWTGCYNTTYKDNIIRKVLKYLQNKNILYPGGVPSTLEHTLEQWDYPNAWPPLQHIMIVGLNNTGNDHAVRLAYQLAETWIRSNYHAYNNTKYMYEKYDATVFGGFGGGGEYKIQEGFGWANGVVLDLIYRYSSELTAKDPIVTASASLSSITAALIALLISLTAGFIGILIYKRRHQRQLLFKDKKRPYTAKYTELRSLPKQSRSAR